MQRITSPANPRVKAVVRLQRQSSERRAADLFCLESPRELGRAMDAGLKVVEVYALASVFSDDREVGRAMRSGADAIEVNRAVLDKLAYRENPHGFVAVMRAESQTLQALAVDTDACVLVCSGLEKPGNLGAILRSADALGAGAVLIDQPDFDLFNPNGIRASTGAIFTVPVITAEPEELMDWLGVNRFRVCATTPDGDTPIERIDATGRIAWVLGSEAEGLTSDWLHAADEAVTVPMGGRATDSLNVSVTAALLLYETQRQRRVT